MTYQKILAVLFAILSFTSIKEAIRLLGSYDADIIENRKELLLINIFVTILFMFLAIWFWRKDPKRKRF